MSAGPERVAIGEITRPHGVKGEVRVRLLTSHPERFLGLEEVYLDGVRNRVRGARVAGNEVILALDGVTDCSQAEALRGKLLEVDPGEVYPLPEGEYYWFQLQGLRVLAADGREVGTVVDVLPNPAHDLLVVEVPGAAGPRRFLVPAVRALVAEVDLSRKQLVVNEIPGLLE